MAVAIVRYHESKPLKQLTLQTTLANSQDIPIPDFGKLAIGIPLGSLIGTLTFFGSPREPSEPDPNTPATNPQPTLNYYQLANVAQPTGITMAVTPGFGYLLPPEIEPWGSIRIVANAQGPVEISKKS